MMPANPGSKPLSAIKGLDMLRKAADAADVTPVVETIIAMKNSGGFLRPSEDGLLWGVNYPAITPNL